MGPSTGRERVTCNIVRAAFGMTKLAELGGDIPDGETWVGVEDGIDIPPLACCYGYQRLVTGLPPSTYVFSSLFKSTSQGVGCLLVQAVEGIAMHIVPHFGFVDIRCSCFLGESEYLIGYLCFVLSEESNAIIQKINLSVLGRTETITSLATKGNLGREA